MIEKDAIKHLLRNHVIDPSCDIVILKKKKIVQDNVMMGYNVAIILF